VWAGTQGDAWDWGWQHVGGLRCGCGHVCLQVEPLGTSLLLQGGLLFGYVQ
jgi:hypothetical protein